ncbi:hypothetical protein V866_000085 [Kwoniella sp. B9012]
MSDPSSLASTLAVPSEAWADAQGSPGLEQINTKVVKVSDDTLGSFQSEYLYHRAELVNGIYFDGNRLFVCYESSVVDILDFVA